MLFRSVTAILEKALVLAGHNLKMDNVEVVKKFADGLPEALVDESKIEQVFVNIFLNAIQSMPEGGVIEISCRNEKVGYGSSVPLAEGEYIVISVKDRGIGIPDEHLGKIFDPYFTTKQIGSGLGLATAHSIVNNHGGYIGVESEPGKGSIFHIYIPASTANVTGTEEDEEVLIKGEGRILVMDDEDIVREVAKEMIISLGYGAELARNGEEAIELYEKAISSGRPFDAVIMDLTVPGGMGGKEALVKLKKIDPEVRSIVSSGYSHNPVMGRYEEFGFTGVLSKPYKIKDLGEALNSVISGECARSSKG